MTRLRIVNRTRGSLLGNRILLVDTWFGRLRGFLGRSEPEPGEGILLAPCSSVHMYGMTFALDLVFLGDGGEVVHTIRELEPWKRTKVIPGARYVLELPVGSIQASGTCVGDLVAWKSPEPVYAPPSAYGGLWGRNGGG